MAIQVASNFMYKGKKFLDERQSFDTILAMTSFPITSLPEGLIAYNKETDKYYKFNSTNDVDTTLGRWREYNGGSGPSTDEKVKLDATSTDAKYLNELIDNSTIEVDATNNCLVVKKIYGQIATVAEINFLTGVTSNIQTQIDNLGKSMTMYGVFGTKADLLASTTPTPVDGNTAIVIADEDNDGKQMTYIYIEYTSAWTQVAESSITIRDFTTDPIDLSRETTGTLPKAKIDAAIARLADVLDKSTYKGTGDGIVKQADTITGLNATIAALNQAVSDSHTHSNKAVLDNIVSNGIGSGFLADNGRYISMLHIGNTQPSYDSQIWIDTSDSISPVLKIFDGTIWIAVSGSSSGGTSVSISSDANNALVNKSDGLYVEDLRPEFDKLNYAQKTVNDIGSVSLLDTPYLFTTTPATTMGHASNNRLEHDLILNESILNYDEIQILISMGDPNDSSTHVKRVAQPCTFKVRSIQFNSSSDSADYSNAYATLVCENTSPSSAAGTYGNVKFTLTCWFKDDKTLHLHTFYNPHTSTKCSSFMIDNILGIKEKTIIVDPLEYVNTKSGIEDTPVGHIIPYIGNTAPKHYLICDGTEYNITDYPYLAQHFKDEFSKVNYFGGDGTTTFAVPDLRGEFLRGTGTNSHAYQGSGSAVGQHQDGTDIPIVAQYIANDTACLYTPGRKTERYPHEIDSVLIEGYTGFNQVRLERAEQGNNTTDIRIESITTRPTNTSVLYCIKYEPTYYMELNQDAYINEYCDYYDTNERIVGRWIDGKPIYRKTIYFGALPNATTITIPSGITDMDNHINLWGTSFREGDKARRLIPYHYQRPDADSPDIISLFISGDNADISVQTTVDRSSETAYIYVEYTKTTDAPNSFDYGMIMNQFAQEALADVAVTDAEVDKCFE